jgi:hypothetical protein
MTVDREKLIEAIEVDFFDASSRQCNEPARCVDAILAEIKAQDHVVAPEQPTEAQWGGLARDIMMWMDMRPLTPRALFRHLDQLGRDIPQWLRDEPEMQALDHVPSKGTRCVIIYRAMISGIEGR